MNRDWLSVGHDLWEEDDEVNFYFSDDEEHDDDVQVIQITAWKNGVTDRVVTVEDEEVDEDDEILERNLRFRSTSLYEVKLKKGTFEQCTAFFVEVSIPLSTTWTKDTLESIMKEIEYFIRYFFDTSNIHVLSERWSFKGNCPEDDDGVNKLVRCGNESDHVYKNFATDIKKWVEDTIPLFSKLALTTDDLMVKVQDHINQTNETLRKHVEDDNNKRILFLPVWRGTKEIVVDITEVSGSTGYRLTVEGPTGREVIKEVDTLVLRHTIDGLSPNTKYTIRTYSNTGSGSVLNQEISVKTQEMKKRSWSLVNFDDILHYRPMYGCKRLVTDVSYIGRDDVEMDNPLLSIPFNELNVLISDDDVDNMIEGLCNACIPSWKTYPSLASRDVVENNGSMVSAFHCQELAVKPKVYILITIPTLPTLTRKTCVSSDRVYRTHKGNPVPGVTPCEQFMDNDENDENCCTVTLAENKVLNKVLPLVCAQRTVDFGSKLVHLKEFFDWYKVTHELPNVHFTMLEIDVEKSGEGLYNVIKFLKPNIARLSIKIGQNKIVPVEDYVNNLLIERCEFVMYDAPYNFTTAEDWPIIAKKMPIVRCDLHTRSEFSSVNFMTMLKDIEKRENFSFTYTFDNTADYVELISEESELRTQYDNTCTQIQQRGYRLSNDEYTHLKSEYTKHHVRVVFEIDEEKVTFMIRTHIFRTQTTF